MLSDHDGRMFLLYLFGIGVSILFMLCFLQAYIVPGATGEFPVIGRFFQTPSGEFVYTHAPETIIKEGKNYQATVKTNLGEFRIDLYEKAAPNTVNNFVFLASSGYYDGVSVHRLMQDFLFQAGSRNTLNKDETDDAFGDPGYTIDDEINWDAIDIPDEQRKKLTELGYTSAPNLPSIKLQKYSVAMANSGNGGTNGSQFFIVLAKDNDTRLYSMQGKHTVFGKVIEGFDVLEKINKTKVNAENPDAPVPKNKITIEKINIYDMTDGNSVGIDNRSGAK